MRPAVVLGGLGEKKNKEKREEEERERILSLEDGISSLPSLFALLFFSSSLDLLVLLVNREGKD